MKVALVGSSGPIYFNAVDLFNSASVAWSTAQLSVARRDLAATSVGNVAIFAGGYGDDPSVVLCAAVLVVLRA